MRPYSILVIDDDAALLKRLTSLLEGKTHRVKTAGDGAKAAQIIDRESFELVITDVFLPGRDGLETIIELSKQNPQTRLIALSGDGRFGTDQYLSLVKKLGVHLVLRRPFSDDQLWAAIEQVFKA